MLTAKQEDSLRHMLGINKPEVRSPKPYRDYAAVNPSDPHWVELERLGMIERYSSHGSYDWYRTTPAGREAAFASHRKVRYSRTKRRYCAFLNLRDALPDLTFHEYITSPRYAEHRSAA